MASQPLQLQQFHAEGSDAFFNALLKSCATPIIPSRASSEYESTPEPFGHPEPPKLHRKHGGVGNFTTKDAVEQQEQRRLLKRLEQKTNAAEQWPLRSSSMRRWKKHPKSIDSGYQPSSLRTSFDSTPSIEGLGIEDGYDQYSDARHDVMRSDGFFPRPRIDFATQVKRPRQDYDISPTQASRPIHKDDAPNLQRGHSTCRRSGPTPEKSDLHGSLLFEPSQKSAVPLVSLPAALPSSTSIDQGLFPLPLRVPDKKTRSDSVYDSDPDLSFEHSSIFQRRGDRSSNTIYSSSLSWAHTFSPTDETKIRPPFHDSKLEEYRLSDPSLLENTHIPLPELPYRSLSWQALSREEYIVALGYHGLCMGMELPLIYAAKPNVGKKWLAEGGVKEAVDEFNERVEEMCKLEVGTTEGMQREDVIH